MNAADLSADRSTPPATPSREVLAAAAGKRSWISLLGWIVVIGVLGLSWHAADMRPLDLLTDSGNMGQFARDFFPPDFTDWRMYVHEMAVTLAVAVWGTALSLVCAVPFGLMSAHNMAPAWVV